MPWPHTDVACEDGDMDEISKQCYMTQLNYRNHLNGLHKDLYGPEESRGRHHIAEAFRIYTDNCSLHARDALGPTLRKLQTGPCH